MNLIQANYKTSKQSAQAPNVSRCSVLRIELRAITQNSVLAILLNQLIFEARQNVDGWIHHTAADLLESSLLDCKVQTIRRYLRELEVLGFLQIRDNPMDRFDRSHEYRLNMKAIETAVIAAGYATDFLPVLSSEHKVPTNKEKKTLKPFRSLKPKELNDKQLPRTRVFSEDPVITAERKAYLQLIRGKAAVDRDSPPDFSVFLEYETRRVSRAIFTRHAETAGEIALVQTVVDGDIPLSYAASLPQLVDLHEITHRSVLHNAIRNFNEVHAWKKMTHPIRYLAKCIDNAITADCFDRFRINPRYA